MIDYDIHGIAGIRLVGSTEEDRAAVARQLGPLRAPLNREPDILIRFVPRIPTEPMVYLGLDTAGFTRDGYFILRSQKARARVRIPFEQVGGRCEILCESGARAVPLLMTLVNLTALSKGFVPLHASAFVYNGTGVLLAGWAKGGKSEALLAFADRGATYVGDEWVLLDADGERMYGIPEHMRLWDWQLRQLPRVRRKIRRSARATFASIHVLEKIHASIPRPMRRLYPVKLLDSAMPALRRQLNITADPRTIFGRQVGPCAANPDKLFLMVSHESQATEIEAADAVEISDRVAASVQFEWLPLMEHYLAFRFAFPERRNHFIEQAGEHHRELVRRALAGKEAYVVRHPYPVQLSKLYSAMAGTVGARSCPEPAMAVSRGMNLAGDTA